MTIEMTWRGNPATKKNSQRIVSGGKRSFIVQSQRYKDYERDCLWQIPAEAKMRISTPCNVKCVYYRATRHRVDLCNLLAATCDILVKAGVLADDNCTIAATHDGSRVVLGDKHPRVEIEIRGE